MSRKDIALNVVYTDMPARDFGAWSNREHEMTRHNYQITLDEASPGMALSDDLLDAMGKILLPKGSILTETTISSLLRRGVDTLSILGEEVSDIDDMAELERHRQRLARLFRKHGEEDMATEILRQFVINFRLGGHS
jgi:hypothetical protein